MKKYQKSLAVVLTTLIVALVSGIIAVGNDSLTIADNSAYVSINGDLHSLIQNADLTLLATEGITDEVYIGDGLWVTRTTILTDTPLILDTTEYAVPFWWCCSRYNPGFAMTSFCACDGRNMASCTSFTRQELQLCWNCNAIHSITGTRNLPGCFYAFYSELGWSYPLRNNDSRRISSGYRLSNRPSHAAIDIQREGGGVGAIYGEMVWSIYAGLVLEAGFNDLAGYRVAILSNVRDPISNNFIVSRYHHLRFHPPVSVNTNIPQGRSIGFVGNTGFTIGGSPEGRSTGHLHLDFNNGGVAVSIPDARMLNPQRFFYSIDFTGSRSRILP